MLHRLGWLEVSWLTRAVISGWLDKALHDSTICSNNLFVKLAIPVNFLQALSLKCWASSLPDHYRPSLAFSGVCIP